MVKKRTMNEVSKLLVVEIQYIRLLHILYFAIAVHWPFVESLAFEPLAMTLKHRPPSLYHSHNFSQETSSQRNLESSQEFYHLLT
jgi:hypothetical protein